MGGSHGHGMVGCEERGYVRAVGWFERTVGGQGGDLAFCKECRLWLATVRVRST